MNIPDLAGAIEKRDAAYELKFLVPAPLAESALAWARRHLSPDPHVNAGHGDGYRVNSLYFDTSSLDVYQRHGSYGKAKYRVRRYGAEDGIFLERKLKSRGLVSKRRTRVPDHDIVLLAMSDPTPDWVGHWFRRRLHARRLFPQCQIRYQRVARVAVTPEGPVRLTLDRDICSFSTNQYQVHEAGSWIPLLPDKCILELKFRLGIPPLFKSLIEELGLTPVPVSKYRLSIQVSGLAPKPAEPELKPEPAKANGHIAAGALLGNHHLVTVGQADTRQRA